MSFSGSLLGTDKPAVLFGSFQRTSTLGVMLAPRLTKECDPSELAGWFRDFGFHTGYHLLYGLESKIPWCCVLEWTVRRLLRLDSNLCFPVDSCRAQYCHCWFHRRTEHSLPIPVEVLVYDGETSICNHGVWYPLWIKGIDR